MPIYCGNNALDSDIVNGNSQLGTRYSCMRKGIGTGLTLPYDAKYAGEYEPIDNRKIYCGNSDNLPDGYDSFGNLPQCLQKGVAIGKRQKALDGGGNVNTNMNNNIVLRNLFYGKVKYFLIFILLIVIFLLFYYLKPSIILEKNNNNNQKIIDWKKFILIYLLVVIPLSIFIFLFL
jgi:hypothetical protein